MKSEYCLNPVKYRTYYLFYSSNCGQVILKMEPNKGRITAAVVKTSEVLSFQTRLQIHQGFQGVLHYLSTDTATPVLAIVGVLVQAGFQCFTACCLTPFIIGLDDMVTQCQWLVTGGIAPALQQWQETALKIPVQTWPRNI